MNEQGTSRASALERLRADSFGGNLSRRAVLKRGAALGLSAPVLASLLAACGGSDSKATATTKPAATSGTGAGSPTSSTAAPTATRVSTSLSPTSASVSPTTGAPASPTTGGGSTGTGAMPGHGRGKADLLRILYWQAPTILNVHFSQGTKDSAASSLVLEPLIDIAQDGTLIPILAAEIPSVENGGVAKDGKSVTYKLKQGVTWSDGTPFTAEDVKFTWQYTSDKDATTTSIAIYQGIEDVTVVDEHTVTLKFKDPTPGWYSPFATGFGGQIVPKHILKDFMGSKARDAAFNLKPIGTGPYIVAEFKPGDVINFALNDRFRDADKPYFKKIEFKGGGDATAAATAALQTGEVDWSWNLQVEKTVLEGLATGNAGVLISSPSSSVERILVQLSDPNTEVNGARSEPTTQHPFLTDKNVRTAFMLACDRETVANQLYGPSGVATANLLTLPPPFASKNTTFKFDVAGANTLLDATDWKRDGSTRKKAGKEMSVLYQTSVNPLRQKTQEIIKAGWEKLGVKVELKSIDAGVYFSSDAGNPDTAGHFYADFEMFTNGPTVPYPIAYMASWKSTNPAVDLAQKSNAWAGTNGEHWINDEYNTLYHQAETELDSGKQAALFIAMNDLVVSEVVEIPLVARTAVAAASKKLKGTDSWGYSTWTPDVANIADWYFEG